MTPPVLSFTRSSCLINPCTSFSSPVLRVLLALAATAHIAVHLQNYVEHHHGDDKYAGTRNASGDEQLHLDILCDEECFRAVRASKAFCVAASEETPDETPVGNGPYSLGFDPLDGSSIIDANFSVGSIFGIWPGNTLVGRTGREQVASAVSLYGPRTLMMIALPGSDDNERNGKVLEVTLVRNRTRWEVSRDDVTIEPEGKIFAPGNLRAVNDNPRYDAMVKYWVSERYQLRYSGGMVPDVYHILAKGRGVFANALSPSAEAKLRLLYEVAPVGLVVECAGGRAVDGSEDRSVLDVVIEHPDHRLGVCFGSSKEVDKYRQIMFG